MKANFRASLIALRLHQMAAATMLIAASIAPPSTAAETGDPPRMKRADSFLGIHFDFHAGEDCTQVGKNTTPAMVENIIQLVQPDYLQIDCKGHAGVSSYPTKVGHPAPGFVGDPLQVWRDVTRHHGVSLYMHYSGVWDSNAVKEHPDWAGRELGRWQAKHDRATSFFGPYAESASDSPTARAGGRLWRGRRLGGRRVLGVRAGLRQSSHRVHSAKRPASRTFRGKPTDPHWYEFLQFNRQAFRDYLNHYITEVKKTNPEFPDLQQLGVHRPHARAGMRQRRLSVR